MGKKRKWKKSLTSDQLKRKAEDKGQEHIHPGDRTTYFKRSLVKRYVPKTSKNKVRIVQPLEVEELKFYGFPVRFHRSVGDKGDDHFGDYLCTYWMKKLLKTCYDIDIEGKCYMCAQQTPDLWDEDFDKAKTFYPDKRVWFWVHDLLSDDPEELLLWSCPWSLHEEILARSSDAETSVYVDVSCPFDGVPVSFEKEGERFPNIKYVNVQIFKKPMPLNPDVIDQLIEFKDLLIIPDYDIVKAAYLGVNVSEINNGIDGDSSGEEDYEHEESNDPPSCFKKEFDKYQDCDDCEFAEECEAGMKKKKPKKQSKPARKEKETEKKVEDEIEDSSGDENDASDQKKRDEIRKKIEAAQNRRKRG